MRIRFLETALVSAADGAAATGNRTYSRRYLKDSDSHQLVRVMIDVAPQPQDSNVSLFNFLRPPVAE